MGTRTLERRYQTLSFQVPALYDSLSWIPRLGASRSVGTSLSSPLPKSNGTTKTNQVSDLLLAVTLVSSRRGDPSVLCVCANTQQFSAQRWTNSVLRVITVQSTLQQLADETNFSKELLELSMLGVWSNALKEGNLAFSLSNPASLSTQNLACGTLLRWTSQSRISPNLHLIKLGDHTLGAWRILLRNCKNWRHSGSKLPISLQG